MCPYTPGYALYDCISQRNLAKRLDTDLAPGTASRETARNVIKAYLRTSQPMGHVHGSHALLTITYNGAP